jgi:hypothetical protein
LWTYGLLSAVIGGTASAVSNFFVLPMIVNGMTMRTLLIATGWNAVGASLIAMFAYLKTHPLPEWDGVYKRTSDQGPVNVRDAAPAAPQLVDSKDATKH